MVGQHETVRDAASFCGTSYTRRLAKGCIRPGGEGKLIMNPEEGRLHIMLLPCTTDDHFPEGLINTRGIPMGTCLTIWINFATQPRPAHRDCDHNYSSGRLQQSAHSLSHHCKWNQLARARFTANQIPSATLLATVNTTEAAVRVRLRGWTRGRPTRMMTACAYAVLGPPAAWTKICRI